MDEIRIELDSISDKTLDIKVIKYVPIKIIIMKEKPIQ